MRGPVLCALLLTTLAAAPATARPEPAFRPGAGLVHPARYQFGRESHRDAVLRHQGYRETRGYHRVRRRTRG